MTSILKTYLIAFLLIVASFTYSQAEGIDFHQGSWAELQAEAKESGKPIFVEFYTTWCGPCKMMARDVFADETVGTYYNEHFLSMKVDAEKDEAELVEFMNISAVPTLAYFSPNGDLLTKVEGALDAESFISQARSLVEFESIEEAYQQNPEDPMAFQAYLTSLSMRDEEKAEELAQTYLATLSEEDWLKEENWALVKAYTADVNRPEFIYLTKHAEDAFDTFGNEYFEYAQVGLTQLMLEAVEEESEEKIGQYQDIFYQFVSLLEPDPKPKAYYDGDLRVLYLSTKGDMKEALSVRGEWLKEYHWDDWEQLFQTGVEVTEETQDPELLAMAEVWSRRAVELDENSLSLLGHAYLLRGMEKEEEAMAQALKASEMNDEPKLQGVIDEFLNP